MQVELAAAADPDWQALKSRIEQSVALEPSQTVLAGRPLTWFRVANPDDLLDQAVSTSGQQSPVESDPFWSVTWRAALGLDRFLADLDLQDVRLLELGAGSGQAGTAAALHGALVTLTDAVELALLVAQLNSWPFRERMTITELCWGQAQLAVAPFPVIIGSDLVYDPQLFPSLEQTARQHLAAEGRLLISEPHRHTGDRFARFIRAAGWRVDEHDIDLGDSRIPIRIFDCRLESPCEE